MYEITQGADKSKGIKTVIYGVEGIGKTTLASHFPDPVFIDMEGSTSHFENIKRFPKPKNWKDLNDMIEYIRATKPCSTIVIDTFDWAEMFEVDDMLAQNKWKSIESPGYGKGYTMSAERIQGFLKKLESDLIDQGINVVLTCHSKIKSFESPEEAGTYDRYELKLGQRTGSQTAPLVKEWADLMLFCNYKTFVEIGSETNKKAKAVGGTERVMYATHTAVWDAKNRFGLPDEMPMDYKCLAKIFEKNEKKENSKPKAKKNDVPKPKEAEAAKESETVKESTRSLTLPDEVPEIVKKLCEEKEYYADDIQTMLYNEKIVKDKFYPLEKVPRKFWDSFVKDFDTRWKGPMDQAIKDNLPF